MRLTRDERAAREAAIESAIGRVGLVRLDYRGKPRGYRDWERRREATHAVNRERSLGRTGGVDDGTWSRHVARENAAR